MHVSEVKALTRRERAIWDFILRYRQEMRFSPSMREIAAGTGLYAASTVHKHIHAMIDKGWLLPCAGKNRAILPNPDLAAEVQNRP